VSEEKGYLVELLENTNRMMQLMESCVAFMNEMSETKKYYPIVLKYIFNLLEHIFTFNKQKIAQTTSPPLLDFTQEFEKMKGLDPLESMQVHAPDEKIYRRIQEILRNFFQCEGGVEQGVAEKTTK
jgi:hypothetical protein